MKFVKAKVIDNNDPDKKSKIKLRILPYMNDVSENLLPWVEPYNSSKDSQTDIGNHKIPEKDSYVRVIIESIVSQEFRYLNGYYVDGLNIFSKWSEIEGNITEISGWEYPQPCEFEIFKDGSAVFRNTETGGTGFYHASGTYHIFDDDGNITSYIKDKSIKIYNDKTNFEIKDSGDVLLETTNATVDIKDAGDILVENSGVTLDMKQAGDYSIKNSISEVKSDSAGNVDITNAACSFNMSATSVKINNNFEVLV